MSETVLEQSLQLILQETTAVAVVAVLLAGGLVGMSLRNTIETVVSSEESEVSRSASDGREPIGDGGTVGRVAETTAQVETADSGDEESPEAFEHRLDRLENEVETLSSTVSTVRNENEQISESVQDIEQNTGRLLNLYEMATRGVNPFSGSGDTEDSVSDGPVRHRSPEKDDEIQTIETDVADENAATLFESDGVDIREQHCVDSVEEVVETETEPADAFQRRKQRSSDAERNSAVEETVEDSFDAAESDDSEPETAVDDDQFGIEETIETGGSEAAASDGGTLLESEDAGEASEPANSVEDPGELALEASTSTESGIQEPATKSSQKSDAETSQEPDTETAQKADAKLDLDAMSEAEPESETEPTPESETTSEPKAAVEPDSERTPEPEASKYDESEGELATGAVPAGHAVSGTDTKPYIESLPEGFAAEVITVEWLEYLIDEVGIKETVRAIHYYERIDWLTEDAAAQLDSYLDGFDAGERGTLSVEHHLQTLDYVEELAASEEME